MPKGGVLATDTFNRTNGGLGGNWTTITGQGAPQINTNVVVTNAVGTDSRAYYSAITWPDNQYAEIQVIAGAVSAGGGAVVRAQSGANSFYNAGYAGGLGATCALQVYRYDSGTANQLSSTTKTINANDLIRFEVEGSTLRAYIAGTLQYGPTTDSTYTSGSAGCSVYVDSGSTTNSKIDNFEGGAVAGYHRSPLVLCDRALWDATAYSFDL